LCHKPASAYLASLDTPFHLVIGLEADRLADRLRQGHSPFLVDYGRIHRGIVPQDRPSFKQLFTLSFGWRTVQGCKCLTVFNSRVAGVTAMLARFLSFLVDVSQRGGGSNHRVFP
jgi:hypothetical protein